MSWKLAVYALYAFTLVSLARGETTSFDDEPEETKTSAQKSKPDLDLPERSAHPQVPDSLLKRIEYLETFQQGPVALEKGWIASTNERYVGHEWLVATTFGEKADDSDVHEPGFHDDLALGVVVKHKHYGLTHMLSKPFDNTGKTMVFQYEVRLHDGIGCSGAYTKLLLKQPSFDPLNLEEATPYVIMFGPDRCGSQNKVHFIVRQKNPSSGEYEEKHMANQVSAKTSDSLTHLYTLVIRQDNTFSVMVDGVEENKGSLLSQTDFNPAFGASAEIDDPQDSKPSDWVEEREIPDPHASKPDDWDENAPKTIPDPDTEKPDYWDEDEDGQWKAPEIPNPEFKGKWKAPMITNPAYKGEWAPKKIPNPHFFEDPTPSNLEPISGIAFEILANDRGIAFDNILLSHDEFAAKEFADLTFFKKQAAEKMFANAIRRAREREERLRSWEEEGATGKLKFFAGEATDLVTENPIKCAVSVLVLVLSLVFYCCFMGGPSQDTGALDEETDEDAHIRALASKIKKQKEEESAEESKGEEPTTTKASPSSVTSDEGEQE